MSGRLNDADGVIWGIVAATVRPLGGRERPRAAPPRPQTAPGQPPVDLRAPPSDPKIGRRAAQNTPTPAPKPRPPADWNRPLDPIEPGLRRRVQRGHDMAPVSLDLHGMTQDQARAALTGFILRAWAERQRHVLIITGKGALGDGVLRRRAPEWLGEPPLRKVVAGLSEAHRRHGGEGALYVALKRAEPTR